MTFVILNIILHFRFQTLICLKSVICEIIKKEKIDRKDRAREREIKEVEKEDRKRDRNRKEGRERYKGGGERNKKEEEIRKRWKKEEEKMEHERRRWGDLGERERGDALWWTPPPLFPNLRNAFRRCVRGELEDEGEEGFVLGM